MVLHVYTLLPFVSESESGAAAFITVGQSSNQRGAMWYFLFILSSHLSVKVKVAQLPIKLCVSFKCISISLHCTE